MNGKTSSKLRQLYRREIRGNFNIFAEIVKDKPFLMPTFIWAWILKMVFKKDAVDILNRMKQQL